MRTTLIAIAALAMSGGTAGAATLVTSGSYTANGGVVEDAGLGVGPGRYRFTLSVTTPVIDIGSFAEKQTETNFFCDFQDGNGEVACGGDNVPTDMPFTQVSPTVYQAFLEVYGPKTAVLPAPFTRYVESESCCNLRLDFQSADAGDYTLTYDAVPEPATWTLLIIGFGAVGAGLRRARRGAATLRYG